MKRLIGILAVLFVVMLAMPQDADAQKYPFGDATTFEPTEVDSTTSDVISVWNQLTYIDMAITGDYTINFDLGNAPEIGAKAYLKVYNDSSATATLTFGDNIKATDESLTNAKTSMIELFYDGTDFNIVAIKQID